MLKTTGILIIHGFAGTIKEVNPLYEYLTAQGYDCRLVTLKGHTGQAKDLSQTTYQDWLHSAEVFLIDYMTRVDNVVVVGFSMGGLIGTYLSSKYKLSGLITINVPYQYWNLKKIYQNIISDLKFRRLLHTKRYLKASQASSLRSMFEFLKLRHHVLPLFNQVTIPALILQTRDDDTTRPVSGRLVYNHIQSADKKIVMLEAGGHQVLQSNDAYQALHHIETFIISIQKRQG